MFYQIFVLRIYYYVVEYRLYLLTVNIEIIERSFVMKQYVVDGFLVI